MPKRARTTSNIKIATFDPITEQVLKEVREKAEEQREKKRLEDEERKKKNDTARVDLNKRLEKYASRLTEKENKRIDNLFDSWGAMAQMVGLDTGVLCEAIKLTYKKMEYSSKRTKRFRQETLNVLKQIETNTRQV